MLLINNKHLEPIEFQTSEIKESSFGIKLPNFLVSPIRNYSKVIIDVVAYMCTMFELDIGHVVYYILASLACMG